MKMANTFELTTIVIGQLESRVAVTLKRFKNDYYNHALMCPITINDIVFQMNGRTTIETSMTTCETTSPPTPSFKLFRVCPGQDNNINELKMQYYA